MNEINDHEISSGTLEPSMYEKIEQLPKGTASSGISWKMKARKGDGVLVFKTITVPMKSKQEIVDSLNAIRDAWKYEGDHPNIVVFLGCTYDNSCHQFIIATEYADGLSLREYMKDGISCSEQATNILVI